MHAPLLDGKAFAGLADTGEILKQVVTEAGSRAGFDHQTLDDLSARSGKLRPSDIVDLLRLQRRMAEDFSWLLCSAAELPHGPGRLEEQVAAWTAHDGSLSHLDRNPCRKKPEEELAPLGPEALLAIRQDLSQAPSLFDLAHGQVDSIPILTSDAG